MAYDMFEILETLAMVETEHFDIRTVTLGINIKDCAHDNIEKVCERVYDKITRIGDKLVSEAQKLERRYGIPIVNKRIAVSPISLVCEPVKTDDLSPVAVALDRAAETLGVDFIGGFSALVTKGSTVTDVQLMQSIPWALSTTKRVCSSVNVGSTHSGINLDAVYQMGKIIKECARLTKDRESIACAKLVVFCNAVEDNPFMAGAFHGPGEPEAMISVGVSGPGVVNNVVKKCGHMDINELANEIKKTAYKITRVGEMVGKEVSKAMKLPFGIIDISLAPTPADGDSVAEILEGMGLERCGTHGTIAALAILNDAVKKGGAMAASNVGGLSGAFIPVSEDQGMIKAVQDGALTLDKLEAMTCVCSVGLDMVVVPGDTSAETIAAIIADEMAIGMINTKTTAVRIIPAFGKKVGESVDFGGLLGKGPVMPINTYKSDVFVKRGGRIPAPINGMKN